MDGDAVVAACQIPVEDLDVDANLARIEERLAAVEADVALFPELALTGFVADDRIERAAVRTDGAALDRVRDLAGAHDTSLVVGYAEAGGDAYHNTVAYVATDGAVTTYRKRHLWGGEADVFEPGTEYVVVDSPAGPAGLVTCYDLNFVTDSAAFLDRGVDALYVVGAWPATHAQNWRLLVRARALDGVRWAVACGRTGRRDLPDAEPTTYAGRSLVARPDGVVAGELAHAPDDLVVTLDNAVFQRQRELVGVQVGNGDANRQ
ncbi:carbon-nitrogen hydrolase family protein [Halorarius halobius]|uniref:carbon-nitrogen hydrolase family protein n=1 Tax=Halorarius halobius TaxID=2962671 RepID=UPI0020CBD550|nr:carbon-nitrogen hydrolase family protein [Halorarius halobius]